MRRTDPAQHTAPEAFIWDGRAGIERYSALTTEPEGKAVFHLDHVGDDAAHDGSAATAVERSPVHWQEYGAAAVNEMASALVMRVKRDMRVSCVGGIAAGPMHFFARWADVQACLEPVREVFSTGRSQEFETRLSGDGQTRRVLLVRLLPEWSDDRARVESVLVIVSDITRVIEQGEALRHLAFKDSLTGLANRSAFSALLDETLHKAAPTGGALGLLLIDIDNFKMVNDTLGHTAGDALLKQATARLGEALGPDVALARFSGDEFIALLPHAGCRSGLEAKAAKVLCSMGEPFTLDERSVYVSCSIGIALYPEDGVSRDQLYARADMAMHEAKRLGKRTIRFYAPRLSQEAEQALRLSTDLRRAVQERQFELMFQPKVRLGAQPQLIGAEALLRWRHPEFGLVSPNVFVPLAEDSGEIFAIGQWVMDEACRTVAAWNRRRDEPLVMAVNVSPRQFTSPALQAEVAAIIQRTGCAPHWMEIEITESVMVMDASEVAETLRAFRAMGIAVAIDDFGTGHSSLGHLNHLTVDVLKIDRSFVAGIDVDPQKRALVSAFLNLAEAFRLATVAEGVETPGEAALLAEMGCRIGQGFLFGKPKTRAAFEERFGIDG